MKIFSIIVLCLLLAFPAYAVRIEELTTGTLKVDHKLAGKVPVRTLGTNYTIGTNDADEAYGYFFFTTAAITVTLPAVVVGMQVCVYTNSTHAVSVDANASDRIILDGVPLDDGDKITNNSSRGDFICLIGESTDGWATLGRYGTWTDGG